MHRLIPAAALGGLLALTVAVPTAVACTPALPVLRASRDRLPAGATLTVSGTDVVDADGDPVDPCAGFGVHPPPGTITRPPETPGPVGVEPGPEPSPSATPLVSLPPLPPLAAPVRAALLARPGQGFPEKPVMVWLSRWYEWQAEQPAGARPLASAAIGPRKAVAGEDDEFTVAFEARVRIPAGTKPGRYVLTAWQPDGADFGRADITVVEELAATGSGTGDLVRLAALALVSGVGALVLAHRRRLALALVRE